MVHAEKAAVRPRVILPDGEGVMLLEDAVRMFVSKFFPGESVSECIPFRITRNADLEIREDNAADLLAKAKVLMNATPPNATMSVAIKALTRRLYAESAGVNAAVGMKKPEPDLKNTIVKANNTYLEIVKKL